MHQESGLIKATWTDGDLDTMSWDSCQVHALAITDDEGLPDDLTPEERLELDDLDPSAPSGLALHFDLDYIVRRVGPVPRRGFEFWVAPATLVFDSVWAVTGDLRSICLPLETRNLHRSTPVIPRDETRWHLEGRDFDLRFKALGFRLYLRRPPRYGRRVLRMADRGGISFEARSFA
ncbi:hypothetical protein DQ384_29310 [Sphaerisporangium album]|uniref:Uncharacterized protein n=1 Tax=Sphaerisporangium album TaxID=509200 RepID=A0A367FA30_9ACTN|nr:hypothetical protein DQ384_29310 [Sphaerisporangium album]